MILHLMSRFDNRPVETIVRPAAASTSQCVWRPARANREHPQMRFAGHAFIPMTPCRAPYDGSAVGRIGPTGSPGPPATEGMSRRRVLTQVTHPARTIIGTDSADAPGPMVGSRTWRRPNTPKPRRSTDCHQPSYFCRSCKSRAVGPAENVSVGAVDCGGRPGYRPDYPDRQHYPGWRTETANRFRSRPHGPPAVVAWKLTQCFATGTAFGIRFVPPRERVTNLIGGHRAGGPNDGVSTALEPWPH